MQDAFTAAAATWPEKGIPTNPAGWLVTTARRKAVDRLRRAAAAERRQRAWGELAIAWDAGEVTGPIADDRLRLIFTCCHPALSLEARVALTLRSLGGLTTEEVARAFLSPTRRWPSGSSGPSARSAKRALPTGCHRPTSSRAARCRAHRDLPDLQRRIPGRQRHGAGAVDLCDEAIRLAGLVVDLLPDEPEPLGLAPCCTSRTRGGRPAPTRGAPAHPGGTGPRGSGTPQGGGGFALLDRAQAMARRASSAEGGHRRRARRGARCRVTDWATIVLLYDRLLEWEPTPVVGSTGPWPWPWPRGRTRAWPCSTSRLWPPALDDYHLYHSTRADLLRRAGRLDEAAVAYRLAHDITDNSVEQSFLARRLDELATAAVTGPRGSADEPEL